VNSPEHPSVRRLPAGVGAALLAALLFGAGTPLAKALMTGMGPWMLAGLLYLGSGLGLATLPLVRRTPSAHTIGAHHRRSWPRPSGPG
jgi:drug/metabolite transporter (DMT)-like permease